jgi:glutamate decarboxylase
MNDPLVVKQLISDELALDGHGVQNMATFLSTWMEPAADELIKENLFKNLSDKVENSTDNCCLIV